MPTHGTEILYATAVICLCLLIHRKTRELEELTGHKGIIYFRRAFLFLAIAAVLRTVVKVILGIIDPFVFISPAIIGPLLLYFTAYSSLLATAFLVMSVSWKDLNKFVQKPIIIYGATAILTFLLLVIKGPALFFIAQFLLFLYAVAAYIHNVLRHKRKAKFASLYMTILVVWFLFIADLLIPNVLHKLQLVIFVANIAVLSLLLHKVGAIDEKA